MLSMVAIKTLLEYFGNKLSRALNWRSIIMATIQSRIAVLERQSGAGYKLVLREDGETDDEARARAGLADVKGLIVFLSESDARL